MHKLMSKVTPFAAMAVCLLFVMQSMGYAGTVPKEARRHMARGQAAVEIAKSSAELEDAIKEFQEASRLAPTWPDPYYNLGLTQEKAGKLKEAVASLKQYLRLAPNAPDAAKIQEHIYKLEYKAEQILTVPEIIDVLVSFWDQQKWQSYDAQGRTGFNWGQYMFVRQGDDAVKVIQTILYYPTRNYYQTLKVTGPVLRYKSSVNVCDESANKEFGDCTSIVEVEVEVVSRTLVKLREKALRGGAGAGVATGDKFSCTFRKK
ncbi:MAG: hypothetical protein C0399_03265 [Syntrophus sp. (in: bacteria)]|nr:hypothetical protein [Syntrophus sp. (in: bacteria)]